MAKIARALGHTATPTHFEHLASTIAKAFNAKFLDKSAKAYYDNKSAGYRQTSNLLPLSSASSPRRTGRP